MQNTLVVEKKQKVNKYVTGIESRVMTALTATYAALKRVHPPSNGKVCKRFLSVLSGYFHCLLLKLSRTFEIDVCSDDDKYIT